MNPRTARISSSNAQLAVFPTAMGWMAALWSPKGLRELTFAHASARRATARLGGCRPLSIDSVPIDALDHRQRDLVRRLEDYADGAPVDFFDVKLDLLAAPPFKYRVILQCRQIPYGQTVTYSRLAARAGSSRAARAVGNVMAINPIPLVIPCHRVVGSGGQLGGFSAPGGVKLKQRLLQLEGCRGYPAKSCFQD